MGAMGFDATVIGNHEFDHKGAGFARMLNSAVASGDTLPAMVCANYRPAADNPDHDFIQQAMDNYGVEETMLLERGGVTYGIFGLVGLDADDCAPSSGFTLEDPAAAAKQTIADTAGDDTQAFQQYGQILGGSGYEDAVALPEGECTAVGNQCLTVPQNSADQHAAFDDAG